MFVSIFVPVLFGGDGNFLIGLLAIETLPMKFFDLASFVSMLSLSCPLLFEVLRLWIPLSSVNPPPLEEDKDLKFNQNYLIEEFIGDLSK